MVETVYWHPEAEKDLKQLSRKKQDFITEIVGRFRKEGTSYNRFGRVTVDKHSFDKFKLKLKEKEPVEINQRVIIDRYHNSWMIWGVKHREDVYKSDYVEELMEREY